MANYIRYANQGATRNQEISDDLLRRLAYLEEMGVTAEVFSGGQDGIETGSSNRVGSVRHDHGGAADVFFHKDGRKLDWANEQDLPIFQQIVAKGKENGVTGFGAGPGYMQPGSMHIGMGKPSVWGAGGKSDTAPAWLKAAYNGAPLGNDPIAEVIAAADPKSVPEAIPNSQMVAKAEEPTSRNGVLVDAYNKITGSDFKVPDQILGVDTDKMTKGFGQIGDFAKSLSQSDADLNKQIQATARAMGGRSGGGSPVEIALLSSMTDRKKRKGSLGGLGGYIG